MIGLNQHLPFNNILIFQESYFLKLRLNITLSGDIALAKFQLEKKFQKIIEINDIKEVQEFFPVPSSAIRRNIREMGPIGYIGIKLKEDFKQFIKNVCFIQEVWFFSTEQPNGNLNKENWWISYQFKDGNCYCAIPFMAMAEILSYYNVRKITENDLAQLTHALCFDDNTVKPGLLKAIKKNNTSAPYVHGLHKYKGKFFPRLIRSLLISYKEKLPENNKGELILLDPFVGSGTSIIEAKLLGLESIGIDIDQLSCLISKTKINLLNLDATILENEIEKILIESDFTSFSVSDKKYSFPPWISRKFQKNKKLGDQEKSEIEIAFWQKLIFSVKPEEIREIFEVCLSDAIARKYNIRMMGTGVGRFAFEIRETKLSTLVKSNLIWVLKIASLINVLKINYDIKMQNSKIIKGNAKKINLPDNCISIVVTSPPYLPASSGREDYLIGKSIGITALGLMSIDEIRDLESQSVGSMKVNGQLNLIGLPNEAIELYYWLKNDELRCIKALPIIFYYQDLIQALREVFRVLLPSGIAIFVIGKESLFYRYKSREVIYRVRCDNIFKKIAQDQGFLIEKQFDLELDKKNSNARPRSMDSFFETIFVLKKNK